MKKIFLLCVLMLTACGSDDEGAPSALTGFQATGEYEITATLDVDTCAVPSQASTNELNFGTWLMAATIYQFYFTDMASLTLTGLDGTTFIYTITGPGFDCIKETNVITATLSYTETGLSGPVVLDWNGSNCYDSATGQSVDESCTRTWFLTGTKL